MATEPANPLAAGDTVELYRAAIGPRGQDYYLRQFTRFDAAGKTGASWHWAAYWSTLNWLVYRQMWSQALAYVASVLGLALLVFGVGKLVLNYSDTTGLLLFLLFLTTAFVVPGLYANAWFYNFCNERISAALRATQDVKEARELLTSQASSNKRFLGQASANVALMALLAGIVTFLFNPAQQLMQLAQGAPEKPAGPAMPEMAAGSQPVLAPAPDRGTVVAATAPVAPTPSAPAPSASAPPAASPAPIAPVVPSPAAQAVVPEAVAGLRTDTQIEHYLAQVAQKDPLPESGPQLMAQAGRPTDAVAKVDKTSPAAPARGDVRRERSLDVPVAAAKVESALPASSPPAAAKPTPPKALPVAAAGNDKPAASKVATGKVTPVDRPAPDTRAVAEKDTPDSGAAPPPASAKPSARAKAASKPQKSWYVQAGAFAQEGNAQNVRLRIEAAGLETSTAPYETPNGRLIRVRVGPFQAKTDAEKAALQVKALDLPAVLFKE